MRILVGYDGSDGADAALNDLRRAGLPREVEALIISVSDGLVDPSSSIADIAGSAMTARRVTATIALVQQQAAQALEEAKEFAAKASDRVALSFPDWKVHAVGLAGNPATELINNADDWKADLVVVGSHGRSVLGRLILGSVSKKVVTDSHHSIRVTRGSVKQSGDLPPKIMIGVDGSFEAEHAVRAVGMRVWPEGAEVRIVGVDDGTSPARISGVLPTARAMISTNERLPDAAGMMSEWAENELGAIGLQVSVAVERGDPQTVLVEEARRWNADSIFVGGRKFSGTIERFWLGSVSTALVTNAHCSIEVVRSATS